MEFSLISASSLDVYQLEGAGLVEMWRRPPAEDRTMPTVDNVHSLELHNTQRDRSRCDTPASSNDQQLSVRKDKVPVTYRVCFLLACLRWNSTGPFFLVAIR